MTCLLPDTAGKRARGDAGCSPERGVALPTNPPAEPVARTAAAIMASAPPWVPLCPGQRESGRR